MAKDKMTIPKILDIDNARKLNNKVYRNTGCFIFLTLPRNNFDWPMPGLKSDIYAYEVINLYKMYNDYGHFFLWFCLLESQLPPLSTVVENKMELEYLMINRDCVMKHYLFISDCARHVLAHGIFQCPSAMSPYVDPKISEMQEIFQTRIKKSWPETKDDWKTMASWICEEADRLYDWIDKWAELWGKVKEGKENLKESFYYGSWKYSRKEDSCVQICKDEYALGTYEGISYKIYDEEDQNMSSFARVFSYQLVRDAKDYLVAAAPSSVRSRYEYNGIFWKSINPNVNLKFLYKCINAYGIENARKRLMNPLPSSMSCPDVFLLYLQGLASEMTKLPTLISSSKLKTSRFCR